MSICFRQWASAWKFLQNLFSCQQNKVNWFSTFSPLPRLRLSDTKSAPKPNHRHSFTSGEPLQGSRHASTTKHAQQKDTRALWVPCPTLHPAPGMATRLLLPCSGCVYRDERPWAARRKSVLHSLKMCSTVERKSALNWREYLCERWL